MNEIAQHKNTVLKYFYKNVLQSIKKNTIKDPKILIYKLMPLTTFQNFRTHAWQAFKQRSSLLKT